MMTLKVYEEMQSGTIFAQGYVRQMKDDDQRWIAVKFKTHWSIYKGSMNATARELVQTGKKFTDMKVVKNLVQCDEDIYDLYK